MGLWNKIQRKASKIRLHPKSRKQTKVETSDDDDDYFEARSTLSVDTVLLDVSVSNKLRLLLVFRRMKLQ